MARRRGLIETENGGWRRGWIDDLPRSEAVAAVEEGRVHLDFERSSLSEDVAMLLDGLGVSSLSELRVLVEAGRGTSVGISAI